MASAPDLEGYDPGDLARLNLGGGSATGSGSNGFTAAATPDSSTSESNLAAHRDSKLSANPNQAAAGQSSASATAGSGQEPGEEINTAVRDALSVVKYRTLVLRFEALVEQFVSASNENELLFESDMVPYQRLLAHRVAQHHGLQTSVLSNGAGPDSECRVIAIKTPDTAVNPVRLADVKVTMSSEQQPQQLHPQGPNLRVLQKDFQSERPRQAGPGSAAGPGASAAQSAENRSYHERKQDYQKARMRILPGGGPDNSPPTPPMGVPGRGTPPARQRLGSEAGRAGSLDGRKAVFRNREQEANDPDFQRGFNRYQQPLAPAPYGAVGPQPGMYMQRTYQGEFPALGSMPMGVPPGHSPDAQLQGQLGLPVQVMHPMAQMGMAGYHPMYMPQPYFAPAGMSPPGMATLPGMAMYGHMPGYAGYPMPASYGFVPARPEGLHPLGMVPPGSPRRSALYSSPGRGGFRGQGDRGRGARSRGASLGRTASATSLGSTRSPTVPAPTHSPQSSPIGRQPLAAPSVSGATAD